MYQDIFKETEQSVSKMQNVLSKIITMKLKKEQISAGVNRFLKKLLRLASPRSRSIFQKLNYIHV